MKNGDVFKGIDDEDWIQFAAVNGSGSLRVSAVSFYCQITASCVSSRRGGSHRGIDSRGRLRAAP
jgi:hypothetical protein